MSSYPTFTSIPQVDGLSTDPRVLGRHIRTLTFPITNLSTTSLILRLCFYPTHSREYGENINRLRNRVKLNVGLQSDYIETDSDFNETSHEIHIMVTQHSYKSK